MSCQLQMFRDQTCHVCCQIRSCLFMTCPCQGATDGIGSESFIELFWKNSSLVRLNIGLCIYVCIYVCIFLCMGYVTPIRLRLLYCPGKWSTNEMARSNSTFLKVNQGDIGFGHLENIPSWKHLDNFSTLSDRNQFFALCTFFFLICLFSQRL